MRLTRARRARGRPRRLAGHGCGPRSGAGHADAARRQAAAEPKAVVELFTSQGCSSCPTADALLGKLAKRDDVIALSLSVDYWDYLGWKDTLASPKFSERQRAYAQARGDGAIYTPQAGRQRADACQRQRRGQDRRARSRRPPRRWRPRACRSGCRRTRTSWSSRPGAAPAGRAGQGSHAVAGRDRQERDGADQARREPGQDHHLQQRGARADPDRHVERQADDRAARAAQLHAARAPSAAPCSCSRATPARSSARRSCGSSSLHVGRVKRSADPTP